MKCKKCHRNLLTVKKRYLKTRFGIKEIAKLLEHIGIDISQYQSLLTYFLGFLEPSYVLCDKCFNEVQSLVSKMNDAMKHCWCVELVSCNYRGRKKYCGDGIQIESLFCKNKDDASFQLRSIAMFYDCDMVIDVSWDLET